MGRRKKNASGLENTLDIPNTHTQKEVKINVKIIEESLRPHLCKILLRVIYNKVVRFAFTEDTVICVVFDHRVCTAVLYTVFVYTK